MRAVVVHEGALRVEGRPEPEPAAGQLAVRVRAAGVNNADLAQRAGRYPAPPGAPQDIPGLECAGETEDGRRVMALLPGGGQAEAVAVDERHVLDVPDGVPWEEAGGFMEAFATAHDALFTQAGLQAGERLLVTGAAGGVGVAAVQLGVATGARVTASARHHQDELRALGADLGVEGPYDVILELVGGDGLTRALELLAPGGRISVIGTGAGARAEIDFGLLMRKRGSIHGSTLRSRTAEEKAEVVRRLGELTLPLLARGEIRVPVEATFPLERAEEAYARFAAGGKLGKIVLVT
ncbi:MAG TPA: zinc-binding dehydrogenase [Gaiellaceae bacterium]|nr:zinc-binding dehydrogenase [Gaiellaceae bacterium]